MSKLTGIWRDPSHDGSGFFLVEGEGGVVGVAYFGHTDDARQLWATGALLPNNKGPIQLHIAKGAGFPTNANTVTRDQVGHLNIALSDDGKTLAAELSLKEIELRAVHFSPMPPADLLRHYIFSCTRVV